MMMVLVSWFLLSLSSPFAQWKESESEEYIMHLTVTETTVASNGNNKQEPQHWWKDADWLFYNWFLQSTRIIIIIILVVGLIEILI